jgi:hypothetical protein
LQTGVFEIVREAIGYCESSMVIQVLHVADVMTWGNGVLVIVVVVVVVV